MIRLLSFIAVVSLLWACKPSAKVEETAPKFYFPTDTVLTAYRDTLRLSGDIKNGFKLDSIAAGDTATFHLEIDGVFHPLTEVWLSLSDPEAAELLYTDTVYMNSMFLPSSDYAGGKFILSQKQTRIPFTFQYHAKKADKRVGVTITAFSEASEANKSGQIQLQTPACQTPAPEFYFPTDTLYTEQNDTLLIRYSSTYRLDALQTGDAVGLAIIVHGVHNRLKQLKITPDNTTDATIVYPDASELDKIFLPSSDYANGVFEMDSSFYTLQLPFRIQALQANEDFGITFEATSDAPHGYGKSRFELKTPIKDTGNTQAAESQH